MYGRGSIKKLGSMKQGQLVICFGFFGGALILLIVGVILLNLAGDIQQLKSQIQGLNSKIDEHGIAIVYLHNELANKVAEHGSAIMSLHNEDVYVDSIVKPQ